MIDKIRKEMTREEFMKIVDADEKYRFNYNGHYYDCPTDLGLVNTCSNNSCIGCWKDAINHIKFKGEEEMKTYQTWEAIKALTENGELEFGDRYDRTLKLDKSGNVTILNCNNDDIKNHYLTTDREWMLIGKEDEVPFMDAVQAYKEGKKVHCILTHFETGSKFKNEYQYKGEIVNNNGGIDMENIFGVAVGTDEILKGKWYIREA